MKTLNPGYYNNTTCAPGTVTMPDSNLNPVTLVPVCNPVDKELINSIINYLISNDIFVINQYTDTAQNPGNFYIAGNGKSNAYLAKQYHLLDYLGSAYLSLISSSRTVNSLGLYSGALLLVNNEDYIVAADNIILDAQIVLNLDKLSTTLTDYVLTVDANGIVNIVDAVNVLTSPHSLQSVTNVGNSTNLTIVLLNATTNYELVPYGQMISTLLTIVGTSQDVLDTINALILLVQNNDPTVQSILDSLILYIPLTEKGVSGGVLNIDLTGKIPINLIPLLTLQNITDAGNLTNTTISALPASLGTELVTLDQLNSIIMSNTPTLDLVLLSGNASANFISLNDGVNDLTLSLNGCLAGYELGPDIKNTTLSPNSLQFVTETIDFLSDVTIISGYNNTYLLNRLLLKDSFVESYIITTADFGHNPASTLSIDLDKLDGLHASSFVTTTLFPVNGTGLTTGNILTFNGTTWVPRIISDESSLNYFAESISGNYAVWGTLRLSSSILFKHGLNKNVVFSSSTASVASLTGIENHITVQGSGAPQITGNYNYGLLSYGTILGNYNTIFSDSATILLNSQFNFIVNTTSQIGTATAASYNIIMNSNADVNSLYYYAGSYSTILNNVGNQYNVLASAGNNSFIANNTNVWIGLTNIISIGSNDSLLYADNATALNLSNGLITGVRGFASGDGVRAQSYNSVSFGSFNTNEISGYSTSAAQLRDRLLSIGNGTATNALSDALILYKSGVLKISGALLLGTTDTNESGAPIEGMIRNNNGNLEIYRSGWQRNLNDQYLMFPMYNGFTYLSASTPPTKTIVGGTNIYDDVHTLRIGDTALFSGDVAETSGITTANGTELIIADQGVYQVNVNFELDITNITIGDQIRIRTALDGQTNLGEFGQGMSALQTLYTTTTSVNFSFLINLQQGGTLTFYIEYLTGVASHDVTTVKEHTRVDAHRIFSNAGQV